MIKPLRLSFFIILGVLINQKTFAQFPYLESFRNSTAAGINFGGSPSAFLTAGGSSYDIASQSHIGTPLDANGAGYLRLTNKTQNQKGYIYSNSIFPSTKGLSVQFEYYIYGGNGADGISFFLFDATASPFVVGGFGGSLGYAQITTTSPTSPGVSKGYLAIGLDEYGNFSNPTEGRQGGIAGVRPGSVTLRGKGDGAALTSGNYAFLTTTRTSDLGFTLVGNNTSRQPDPTSTGYRRVFMDMVPNPNGGYNITVRITRGGPTLQTSTVINNYYYPEVAPGTLRYGFASSTGSFTNFHEIRNVMIDVLESDKLLAPVAAHDQLVICQGKQGLIDVTANDKTDNAGGTINKATIDLDPATVGIQNTFTVAGKGEFSLNPDGMVLFIPETAFIGSVSASYTVKDTYGKTSNVADVTLIYSAAPAQPDAGTDQLLTTTTPASYTMQGSSAGANLGKWTQVSGPGTAVFVNNTQNNTQVNNLIGGTYVFRWSVTSPGGCELFDDVQIIINHRPVATSDFITTNLNTNIPIPILDNDTDADGNSTIDKGSISIKSSPQHGTLVVDPVTGIVTYRPDIGYSGLDSFVYTIKDNYGAESNTAIVTIAVNIKPIGDPDIITTTTGTPIDIHVLDNDPGRTGATVIKNSDPANGSIIINGDGSIKYTPKPGFSGKDTFTYKLRNKDGLESDPITVTVNVTPVGSDDFRTTKTDVPVIVPVKDNDLSKLGTSIIIETNPAKGTVTFNQAGNVVYTPKPGYSGKDMFTYILRTADGLQSDVIAVKIDVFPDGSSNNTSTPFNTPVTINVKENDMSKVGTTVLIKTNPTRGTVVVDNDGNTIYTPNTGFTGTDTYTYILRTADGLESEPITVNVTVNAPPAIPAKIGLAKALISNTKNQDGSYGLTYRFTIVNYGEIGANNVSITDDLSLTFKDAKYIVKNISATGTLKANTAFNGSSIKEMLLNTSTLPAQYKEQVDVELTVTLINKEGVFNNMAFAKAISVSNGAITEDQSTNGLNPDPVSPGDVSPSIPTPVSLLYQGLFVPGGFSPNGDGINDYFVIENASGKQILLEIYNRWGNKIYASKNYKNEWDGKTTEGIHVGDEVPSGTYYYIIVLDGKDKRVGYITINR